MSQESTTQSESQPQAQPGKRLTKSEFLEKIQTNLEECHHDMNALIEKSKTAMLSANDIESMFDTLYDAKDLINFYYTQLKLETDDELVTKEKSWAQKHMEELVECHVGCSAEIKCFKNKDIKSKNGNSVGEVDEIRVRFVPYERSSQVIIMRNWMEVDRWFWTKNHSQDLEDYEASIRTSTPTSHMYRSSSYDYYDRYGDHYD